VLQNNLESAEEIARQLRLRDIGGIIVIDFIDMEDQRNQDAVLLRLREHLAKDKTRTQVFDVSHLGLVEMTRKNVSAGIGCELGDVRVGRDGIARPMESCPAGWRSSQGSSHHHR
ncbi:ribonuclease E/G, partial [Actinomycetota bacterium]